MEITLAEYISNVRSELIRTTWHFSPEQASRIVMDNIDSLSKYYSDKKSAWICAAEIGFNY